MTITSEAEELAHQLLGHGVFALLGFGRLALARQP